MQHGGHITKDLLGPRGVPVGGGGAEIITDDFSADSGLWLDGDLAPAAITVSGGRGIWTPTGTEQNTTANAASDPNGNEANATDGWGAYNVGLSVEPADVHTGSYALRQTITVATSPRATFVVAAPYWYLADIYLKNETGEHATFFAGSRFSPQTGFTAVGAGWNRGIASARAFRASSDIRFQFSAETIGVDNSSLIDNASILRMSTETLIRWQPVTSVCEVAAAIWQSAGTQAGVIIGKDINNFIVLLSSGVNTLLLTKRVAGTFTDVGSGAAVYDVGRVLRLTPNASFTEFTASYNDVEVLSAQAINDFAADVSGGKFTVPYYVGLFNIANEGNIDLDSFDNFAVWRVGGTYPYNSSSEPEQATLTVNTTKVIVTSEDEPNWFGRATTEVLSDGTVVLVYYRANEHATNDGALHIRFSDDYGATWTAEDTDLDGDPVSGFPMNPPDVEEGQDATEPWLYQTATGKLLVHMWRMDWDTDNYDGPYQSVSTDSGLTWSVPAPLNITNITDLFTIYISDDYFVYDGKIYAACRFTTELGAGGISWCGMLVSEDEGTSWTYSDIPGTVNTNEIGMEYVGDNHITAVIRTNAHTQTLATDSFDMGTSWRSACRDITWRVGQSGRHRIWTRSHLEQSKADWWDDNQLVMCGFIFTEDSKRRSCLWFSKDKGTTWSPPRYVDDAYLDGGYGDVFYNPTTSEYVYINYRGGTQADLVQYNISVDWGS